LQPRRGEHGEVGAAHAGCQPVCQACVCRHSQAGVFGCLAAWQPWPAIIGKSTSVHCSRSRIMAGGSGTHMLSMLLIPLHSAGKVPVSSVPLR
jgi:hypothetical protein